MLSHQILGRERVLLGNPVNYDTDTKKSMTDKQLKMDQPLDYLLKNEYSSFKEDNRDGMIAVFFPVSPSFKADHYGDRDEWVRVLLDHPSL